jgi:sterol desaturase/sphingolipid hydroxylase (fatty acid hydroxylase superfamily)
MSDGALRISIILTLLGVFIALERLMPARANQLTLVRMGRHSVLAFFGALVSRLALAGGLAGVALFAQDRGIGIFNLFDFPLWLAVLLAVVVMDFALWAQHLVLHRVPFLWRLHRVHHCDTVMDVSTALRFHPFEILASLMFKAGLVLALGAPSIAVIAFEVILGAGALFTHANIALSPKWERALRFAFITPALHLIHHSPNPVETNSNFGFSTNIWDRIFRTYRAQPLAEVPIVGLEQWRDDKDQSLKAMLGNPFTR